MVFSKPIVEAVETFVANAPKSILKLVFIQNLDVIYSERADYSFLNFLGDVGALNGVLSLLSVFVLGNVFSMNIVMENNIISNVFEERPTENNTKIKLVKINYF